MVTLMDPPHRHIITPFSIFRGGIQKHTALNDRCRQNNVNHAALVVARTSAGARAKKDILELYCPVLASAVAIVVVPLVIDLLPFGDALSVAVC